MGWGALIGLVILFQALIYSFHRLRKREALTRWRFVVGVTAFFSLVFFIGSTGLSNFSWETLTVWCGLTLLQMVVTYLLAPIFGIR